MIRDVKGKSATSLEKFLAINAPYVGIVSPASYFTTLGWHIALEENGDAVVRRSADVDLGHFNHTTNTSVDDIIENSYQNGFVAGDRSDIALSRIEPVLTMATMDQSHCSIKVPPSVNHQDMDMDFVEGPSKTPIEGLRGPDHLVEGMAKVNEKNPMGVGTVENARLGGVKDHSTARLNEETSSTLLSDRLTNADVTTPYSNDFSASTNISALGNLLPLAPERLECRNIDFDFQFIPGVEYEIFDPFGDNPFDPINISLDFGDDFDVNFDAVLDNPDSEN